ncbi:MAG: DUF3422 family protein [Wenzhouxiangella sp.]|nr:MAG: DUF3422 family protein [Wenzhouxiangella sp.]
MNLKFHPEHPALAGELHSRPHTVLNAPCAVAHLAIIPGGDTGLRELMVELDAAGDTVVDERHHAVNYGALELRWERHTEFESLAISRACSGQRGQRSPVDDLPQGWLERIGGHVVSAALVFVENGGGGCGDHELPEFLGSRHVVGSRVLGDAAIVHTAFADSGDGYVRYHVQDLGMGPDQTGRLVQRLVEIETYRMMALLGLPVAKTLAPGLGRLEQRLAELVMRLDAVTDLAEEQALLDELFDLAQTCEQQVADSAYRFAATQAYGRIVGDRLGDLREQRLDHLQAMGEFLERRFEPALRTCEATARRLESLSQRISRTADLVRTRVDVGLQKQNRSLLATMARRSQMQLRLQQTVEGLSVMAISYYSLGILSYLLAGFIETDRLRMVISLTAPAFLIAIWFLLRRWRQHLAEDEE